MIFFKGSALFRSSISLVPSSVVGVPGVASQTVTREIAIEIIAEARGVPRLQSIGGVIGRARQPLR